MTTIDRLLIVTDFNDETTRHQAAQVLPDLSSDTLRRILTGATAVRAEALRVLRIRATTEPQT
jgi:hypothetical protein